jgi:hypothetical protein
MTSWIICSCACWNDGFEEPRVTDAFGSGATEADCLSLDGTGVSGCARAAARRGRSVAMVDAGVGVAAALGVDAMRGVGLPGGMFSSPGTGVATAT